MPRVKESSVQQLKNLLRIEQVVGAHTQLKKRGSRWVGLCPFHNEKTPSFSVDAEKGFYKCFGCGKGGDAIKFVMEVERREFLEAVESLAERFHVSLEYEEGGPTAATRSLRAQLIALHDAAASFFREAFLARTELGSFARDYWERQRRFPPELAEEFRIGFAPVEDHALAAHLIRLKYPEEALGGSGLFFERQGYLGAARWRSRFRGRLMIPIRDTSDRIVAFTARKTDLTPAEDPAAESKYVNSPETEIFKKSHLLFNLGRARTQVGDRQPFLLVEGQLDALRCWQVGLKSAVAPQGTSITDTQVALLSRYGRRVDCFLDGDAAGQKAALRFLPMALKAGLELRFLPLEPGQDPDSFFRERGAAGYEELSGRALSAMAFACRALLPRPSEASAMEKAEACRMLFEILSQAESEVAQSVYLHEAAPLLGTDAHAPQTLVADFRRFRAARTRGGATSAAAAAPRPAVGEGEPGLESNLPGLDRPVEEDLLAIFLAVPACRAAMARRVQPEWIDAGRQAGRILDRCLAAVLHDAWPEGGAAELLETVEERGYLASIEALSVLRGEGASSQELKMEIDLALQRLFLRHLEPQLALADQRLAGASATDLKEMGKLLADKQQLLAKRRNPPTIDRF